MAKGRKRKVEPGALVEAAAAPPSRPTLDAFLDFVFVEFGGPQATARMVVEEFRAAQTGGIVRTRLIEALLRRLVEADRKGRPSDEAHLLSDEDLEQHIAERERRLLAAEPSRAGPDEPVPGPAGPQPAAQPPA